MQGRNIIKDSNKDIYCIIDPLLCLQEAQRVPHSSLLECRYCHSLSLPQAQSKKHECPICKCFTDLPQNYSSIVPVTSSDIILTNQPPIQNKHQPKTKTKTKMKESQGKVLRLLIVCQSDIAGDCVDGLQCLVEILGGFRDGAVQLCLVMYDDRVKVVELEAEGRVVVVAGEALGLVNDKYYPVGEDSLTQLFEVLSYPKYPRTTLNCTKILNELLQSLTPSPTLVLWLGSLHQSTQLYPIPKPPNIQLSLILKIPNSLSTQSQLQSLSQLTKHCSRVKYILKSDQKKTMTEKIHYQIYDLLWNYGVARLRVEGSRERKYPPEIVTSRDRVFGSLRDCVVVRLGGQVESNQRVQVRMGYIQVVDREEEGEDECPQLSTNSLHSPHKLLLITLTIPQQPPIPPLSLLRYLQLYKLLKQNPTTLQLHSLQLKNDTDMEILHFLRECSYLQRLQLTASIQNPNCIYAVWPWVGLRGRGDGRTAGVRFVYYFTGFYIDQLEVQEYRKANKGKQGAPELPYSAQIGDLNSLCQILYSSFEKRIPTYYQHILEDIEVPEHLIDSDEENSEQTPFGQQRCEDNRYYQYRIK